MNENKKPEVNPDVVHEHLADGSKIEKPHPNSVAKPISVTDVSVDYSESLEKPALPEEELPKAKKGKK